MATQHHMTAPEIMKSADDRHRAFAAAAAVQTGVATQFWLELLAYPPGSARSLWLFVDGAWRHLDNPNEGMQISVQEVFCSCSGHMEVAVWYMNDVIVGLVVRTK